MDGVTTFHRPGSYDARRDVFAGPVGCFVHLTQKRWPADDGRRVVLADDMQALADRLAKMRAAGEIE